MPVVQVAGSQVDYVVDGHGPGLVLVHGTGGSAQRNWDSVVARFAQRRTVVRPNYSGSGETRDDGRVLSTEFLAAQVVAAAEAAAAIPFDLVGLSLGAAVAVQIAADFPGNVRSVIPVAGFAHAHDPWLKLEFGLWRRLIDRDRDAFARLILLSGFSPAHVAALDDETVEARVADIVANNDWAGMTRHIDLDLTLDVATAATRITCPALVIGCALDAMVPVIHARRLAALIPGADYTEMACGHLAPLESPDPFVDLVEAFLTRAKEHAIPPTTL